MKTRIALVLLLLSTTTYGMGAIREALTNHVYVPPPVATNTPPAPPAPVPEPVPPVVTSSVPVVVPIPAGAILTIKGTSGTNLRFTFTGWQDWPTSGETKVLVGKLMMQSDQMSKAAFVDSISTANIKAGSKTLENAFGTGEHSINANKGERVRVWISNGSRKSNVVEWKWPYPNT